MKVGRGTVYRNGKFYAVRYWVNNEQRYKGGFKTISDAQAYLADVAIRKKKAVPIPVGADKMTVNTLLDKVITYNTTIKPLKAIKDKENRKDNLLTYFNGWRVSQVTPSSIQGYVVFRKQQGISASTINRETDVLRSALRLAKKNEEISYIPEFEKLEEPEARDVTFKENEIETFRIALTEDCRAVFDFQYETGCRISEAVTLRWSQVNFDNEVVFWRHTKSSRKPKVYPFSNRLRDILKQQRNVVDTLQKELRPRRIIEYVFPRTSSEKVKGSPMFYWDKWQQREKCGKWFYDRWQDALKTAKLQDRIPHDLRRGAAIRRDRQGYSVDDNMRLAGWRTDKMLQRYMEGKDVEHLRGVVKQHEDEQKAKPSRKRG